MGNKSKVRRLSIEEAEMSEYLKVGKSNNFDPFDSLFDSKESDEVDMEEAVDTDVNNNDPEYVEEDIDLDDMDDENDSIIDDKGETDDEEESSDSDVDDIIFYDDDQSEDEENVSVESVPDDAEMPDDDVGELDECDEIDDEEPIVHTAEIMIGQSGDEYVEENITLDSESSSEEPSENTVDEPVNVSEDLDDIDEEESFDEVDESASDTDISLEESHDQSESVDEENGTEEFSGEEQHEESVPEDDDVRDFVEEYVRNENNRKFTDKVLEISKLFDKIFNRPELEKTNSVTIDGVKYTISEEYDTDEISKKLRELTIIVSGEVGVDNVDKYKDDIYKATIVLTTVTSKREDKVPSDIVSDRYEIGMMNLKEYVSKGLKDQFEDFVEKNKDFGDSVRHNRSIVENEINPKIIMNILNNENDSVFDEQRALDMEFREGPFYSILKQVMSKERMVDVPNTPLRMSVTINQLTKYFAIADFNTGYRVICIDTDEIEQLSCNPFVLNKGFPFTYAREVGGPNNYRVRYIYRDSCEEKSVAVVRRLQKIVAGDYIHDRYMVNLFGNYVVGYTTDIKTIDAFESGEYKSKEKGNSPYVVGRAHTNRIGIMVIEKHAVKQNTKASGEIPIYDFTKNYDLVTVASCRYITDTRTLQDNTVPPEGKYVRYTITQYDEINSCIIKDGFIACLKAISMEHEQKFGPEVRFSIEYELDRAALNPVSIDRLVYEGQLLLPSRQKPCNEFGLQTTKILPRENRVREIPFDKGRADSRYFSSARTIASIYPPSIVNNFNIYKGREGLEEFVKGRGYLECHEPQPFTFDVDPFKCGMELSNPYVKNMVKIDVNSLNSLDNQEFNKLRMLQMRFESEETVKNDDFGSFLFKAYDILESISGLK